VNGVLVAITLFFPALTFWSWRLGRGRHSPGWIFYYRVYSAFVLAADVHAAVWSYLADDYIAVGIYVVAIAIWAQILWEIHDDENKKKPRKKRKRISERVGVRRGRLVAVPIPTR